MKFRSAASDCETTHEPGRVVDRLSFWQGCYLHERKLDRQLQINGPLIEAEGFENLVRGSRVTMEEVLGRSPGNWYIEANEFEVTRPCRRCPLNSNTSRSSSN
jgi:hypothetical protein